MDVFAHSGGYPDRGITLGQLLQHPLEEMDGSIFRSEMPQAKKIKIVFLMISKLYAIIVLLMDEVIQNWQGTQINS